MSKRDGFRCPSIKSIELTKQGEHNEALEVLNQRLPNRCDFRGRQPTCTLYHHAAVIARLWESFRGQLPLRTAPARKPESPLALYG
jgi:hypothetical protein